VHTKRILAFVVSGCLAAIALRGQSISDDEIRFGTRPYVPQATAAIRAQANLVEVRVIVRDPDGQPVSGLQKASFQLFDNGKPQSISNFSVESSTHATTAPAAADAVPVAAEPSATPAVAAPQPRYVALFFDDMNTRMGEIAPARTAAEKFIKGALEPGDRVGIFTSSSIVTLEFTTDVDKVLSSLAQIRTHFKRPDAGAPGCPRITPYQAHLIINMNDRQAFDLAVAEALVLGCLRNIPRNMLGSIVQRRANEVYSTTQNFSLDSLDTIRDVVRYLGKMPGRRMLLLASSGFLTSSSHLLRQQDKLIDAALHANVVINSLDANGLTVDVLGGDPSDGPPIVTSGEMMAFSNRLRSEQREVFGDTLAVFANGTGGRFFHNSNDIDRGFRELASAPEITYVLGFSPENLKFDGNYHSLKVKLVSPAHLTLNARRGYFAPEKAKPAELTVPEKFDAAVLASEEIAGMPVEVSTHAGVSDASGPVLKVVVHFDVRSLQFQRRGDRSVQRLRFVTALFEPQGKFLAAVEAVVDLSLTDAKLASLSVHGLDQSITLQAPAGSYRLRTVAQELLHGTLAALTRPVEIR
jgi:VWFA-related protein